MQREILAEKGLQSRARRRAMTRSQASPSPANPTNIHCSTSKTSQPRSCKTAQLPTCQGHLPAPKTPAPKYLLSAIKYLDDASFMKIRFLGVN